MSARTSSKPRPARAEPAGDLPLATPARPAIPALVPALVAAYLVLLFLGYAVFRSPAAMRRGSEMSVPRAAFTSANAATLTGFQISVSINDYQPAGRSAVLLLTVCGSLLVTIVSSLAVVRILRLPYPDASVVTACLVAEGVAVLAGTCFLTEFGQDFFATVLQSAAAFANSGLYAGKLSKPTEFRLQGVILPLAFIGGLGIPVLMELYDRLFGGKPLSRHARTVLLTSAALYALATLAFTLLQWPGNDFPAWRTTLARSSAAAIDCRTAGIPLQFAYEFPRPVQWLMIPLMAIGASPAGTGGGLKTTTLIALFSGAYAALKRRQVPRLLGIAAAWLALYLLIASTALTFLLWTESQAPPDRLLFLAVSAASNVGLSHEPVSLSPAGLYTLSLTMISARLAPMLILWWTALTTPDADLAVG